LEPSPQLHGIWVLRDALLSTPYLEDRDKKTGGSSVIVELRREQSHENTEQHSSHVRRLVRRLQRQHPLGDHTPLGLGNTGRRLEHVDGLGGEPRALDLEEVI
jgi:hypothetical protein